MPYAKDTTVSPERTRNEIEQLLRRAGATGFGYAYQHDTSMIEFVLRSRRIRFVVAIPPLEQFRKTPGGITRSADGARKAREQEERRLYRALLLVIKAKLEAIDSGLRSFDEEFAVDTVMPDGRTVGQWLLPAVGEAVAQNRMPRLLPMFSPENP